MAKNKKKNTRVFYTDEARIAMYSAIPAEQFKELFMTMLTYQYGDDSILDKIQDPMVKVLFSREKVDIDRNEEEWLKRKEIYKQNGSKGGRPKSGQSNFQDIVEQKKEVLSPKQAEDLRNWYGILSTKDNDRYFNSSWNQFFDDYETAKIAANNYLIEELKTHKSWLM